VDGGWTAADPRDGLREVVQQGGVGVGAEGAQLVQPGNPLGEVVLATIAKSFRQFANGRGLTVGRLEHGADLLPLRERMMSITRRVIATNATQM